VIRSVLSLRAAPGQRSALERFYDRHAVLDRARRFRGCRDAVLLRSVDNTTAVTHLVIADWDTAEDYRRWVEDPWRATLAPQLADLLDSGGEPLVGGLFEFVARSPMTDEMHRPVEPKEYP
jgi:heme-degrading monooxygenase HmoA